MKDKTTKKNIIWASAAYGHVPTDPVTPKAAIGIGTHALQPRCLKRKAEQKMRTKKHAEVFTPVWLCNKMCNFYMEEWFGRKDVFNTELEDGRKWSTNPDKVIFPAEKDWRQFVDCRMLEVTCGEAPFLVSRYDAATGEPIPMRDRVGLLDRKLRVVDENCGSEKEWLKWTYRAYESTYGYEFQGDSLLIARINLLLTFCDHVREKWQREPGAAELRKVANIIAWNLWQMDGLKGTVPYAGEREKFTQMSMFCENDGKKDGNGKKNGTENGDGTECVLRNWRGSGQYRTCQFKEIHKEGGKKK